MKSKNLIELSKVVKVPEFIIINKNDQIPKLKKKKYIVRSSSSKEDQKNKSYAGVFESIGPISEKKVPKIINKIFSNNEINKIIIQEYIDGLSGVIFCYKNTILLEYTEKKEGVTSGLVKPFCALLPSKIKKYSEIYKSIKKIRKKFGDCDIEFINLRNPSFVQVRPITSDLIIDKKLILLKEKLQELEWSHWIENDFCKILKERKDYSKELINLFINNIPKIYDRIFKKKIHFPKKIFIKIGEQYFLSSKVISSLKLNFFDTLKLIFYYKKNYNKINFNSSTKNILFKYSFIISLYQSITRSENFKQRNNFYNKLILKSKKEIYKKDYSFPLTLDSEIKFCKEKKEWIKIGYNNSKGLVVVDGGFKGKPFYLKNNKQKIPKNSLLITKQLYPWLHEHLEQISGIICEEGAYTSHLSILAREKKLPLIIQARGITKYKNLNKYIDQLKTKK